MKRSESVLLGRDRDALDILIPLHAVPQPRILDATHNKGVMWKKTVWKPVRMDINPVYPVDVCADFRLMPFADACFDVIVFDPPHLPHGAASRTTTKDFAVRYGCDNRSDGRRGVNVSALFLPFLMEARRVLKHGGIVLAKICDLINANRYQWQHVDFILACREAGMTCCDLLIKRDPSTGLASGTWRNCFHLRRSHCYWIVVRNSKSCERKDHEGFKGSGPEAGE